MILPPKSRVPTTTTTEARKATQETGKPLRKQERNRKETGNKQETNRKQTHLNLKQARQ
jgi:hypothetical protein